MAQHVHIIRCYVSDALTAPARFHVDLRDLIWDFAYAPIAIGIAFATERLDVLQFLTIRSYLALVFAALVLLLLVLAIWP